MPPWAILGLVLSAFSCMASGRDDSLGEAQTLLAAQRARPDAAQFERAKGIVEAEAARQPGAARAWTLLAWARTIEHRFAEALAAAQTAAGLAPDDPRTLALLSDALVELGRYEEAVTVTQRLADTSPGIPAWIRAAHIRFLYGDLEGAIEIMAMAARAASPYSEEAAWTWLDLARLELHAGDLAATNGAIAAAETAFPQLPGILSAKARLRIAAGDDNTALDLLRQSLAAQTTAEDALTAWRLARRMGDAGAAKHFAALLDALARLDTLGLSRRALAEYFAEIGQTQRALELARDELAARPDIYSHATLAAVLQQAGEAAQAREHARQALALGTPDAQLRQPMAAILAASSAGAPAGGP